MKEDFSDESKGESKSDFCQKTGQKTTSAAGAIQAA